MSLTATFDDLSSTFIPNNIYKKTSKVAQEDKETTNDFLYETNTMLLKVQSSQIKEYKSNNYVLSNLKAKINLLTIPERWIADAIEEPNYLCRQKTFEVIQYLYNSFEYYPERIGASKDGGIFIYYVNYHNNKTLSVEVSNDLEMAALVNRDKEIIKVVDIFNFDFSEIVQAYVS